MLPPIELRAIPSPMPRSAVCLFGVESRGEPSQVEGSIGGGAMSEGLRVYNLFPTLAGPIAGWTAEIPRVAAMAFNAVYVNPFHYPRFSRSLFAVQDYYPLEPPLRRKAPGSDDALPPGVTQTARGQWLRPVT